MDISFKDFAADNPKLCAAKHWVEDNDFLSKIGMYIPGKENLPLGFVKLYPQDFVVEEIAEDRTQYSIDKDHADVYQESSEGETVYATLVKYNLTTFEAEKLLAEQLGCSESQIQHAGIKDLRAVTAQRISIRKVSIDAVRAVNHPQFFLKDVIQGKGILNPGSLYGNRFTILIRTTSDLYTDAVNQQFVKQFKQVLDLGFSNFYYLQRFAAPRYNSPAWGRDVLLGNFEAAVKGMIVDTSPTEPELFTNARTALASKWGDWLQMLQYIEDSVPYDQFQYEKTFLTHLHNNPDDYLGALRQEINHVRLCVYGFGALLHNKQLSYLMRTGRSVPETLPVVVSKKRDDLSTYKFLLERECAWPPKFDGLNSFPEISRYASRVKTKSSVIVDDVSVTADGIALVFTLKKGEYATTMLSHLFNLLGGTLSKHDITMSTVDSSKLPAATQNYFQPVIDDTVLE